MVNVSQIDIYVTDPTWKEVFNEAVNTFYLQLGDVGHGKELLRAREETCCNQ